MVVQPEGSSLKQAVKYIGMMRKEKKDVNLSDLVDKAALRFDLTPKETDFLLRLILEKK